MDEKELFIMKTAHKGEMKFHVMSLEEEPDEAHAEVLKAALETSIMKLGINMERKNREVCTLIRGAIALLYHPFFIYDSGAEFHAD